MLTDEEIAAILKKASFPLVGNPSEERLRASRSDKSGSHSSNINELADSLVAEANKKGGRDNISLILGVI